MPKDQAPTFDIQPAPEQSSHHNRAVVVLAVVAVLIVAAAFLLKARQKRAYEAYLRTPEGQLTALGQTSAPVTSTPEERAIELEALGKSSGSTPMSQADMLKQLPQE